MNTIKRYNTLTEYYNNKYHKKIAKIPLNANFTCPNRDGTKGYGGCTYCSKMGSGDTIENPLDSLLEQFKEGVKRIQSKWKNCGYIPYLQAFSNTYAPLEKLKVIYETILSFDEKNIVGLSIATRPDCFNLELYDYLKELNSKIPLTIELGLQSSNEETALKIHRCCTNQEFKECVIELRKRKIEVVVHIINGLPNEKKEDMLNTIDFINHLDIQGIKFHSLLLLKDTILYEEYKIAPFKILTLEEYCSIVVEQLKRLNPSVIVHRLAADTTFDSIVLPKWPIKKLVVMNEIDKLLRKQDAYQGQDFK